MHVNVIAVSYSQEGERKRIINEGLKMKKKITFSTGRKMPCERKGELKPILFLSFGIYHTSKCCQTTQDSQLFE